MTNETIQLDLNEDSIHMLIESYIKATLSNPSVEVFEECVNKVGIDVDEICKAAGRAILNEAITMVLKQEIASKEAVDQGQELDLEYDTGEEQ